MALIALAADKGSPGVTTAALALGAVWPARAIVAECDPAGGDLVYRLPGSDGGPLDPNLGLLSLAATARRGLHPGQVWEHTQVLSGGLDVLVGLATAEQAGGLSGLWSVFGQALSLIPDADAFADCGRLGPATPMAELMAHAAMVLLLARATPDGVAHLRDRLTVLAAALDRGAMGAGPSLGVVLVAPPNEGRRAAEQVSSLLHSAQLPANVVGVLAHDPKGAAMLAGEWSGRLDKSPLIRSAREIVLSLHQRLGPGAQARAR
jgi:hypothetical protein